MVGGGRVGEGVCDRVVGSDGGQPGGLKSSYTVASQQITPKIQPRDNTIIPSRSTEGCGKS